MLEGAVLNILNVWVKMKMVCKAIEAIESSLVSIKQAGTWRKLSRANADLPTAPFDSEVTGIP